MVALEGPTTVRNADGRRDLSLIRESGSTARVLNLALAYERFGETEEFNAKPMFRNKRLNRSLILKHAVRPHERELFTRPVTSSTKVILPYSVKELELGGVSFLIGERRFERIVRDTVEGYDNETDLHREREPGTPRIVERPGGAECGDDCRGGKPDGHRQQFSQRDEQHHAPFGGELRGHLTACHMTLRFVGMNPVSYNTDDEKYAR